jgi:hypothetical protein
LFWFKIMFFYWSQFEHSLNCKKEWLRRSPSFFFFDRRFMNEWYRIIEIWMKLSSLPHVVFFFHFSVNELTFPHSFFFSFSKHLKIVSSDVLNNSFYIEKIKWQNSQTEKLKKKTQHGKDCSISFISLLSYIIHS